MADYDGSLLFNTKVDTSGFESLASAAASSAAKVTAAFTAAVGAAGKVGSDFEAGMSSVGSIAMESAENMALLSDKAAEMGAKTQFSAAESAKAFEYMSMAGWKTEQMLGGIEGIMNLAAASGENLAAVSDIVTDALTAFGMTAADSGKFADILAAASSNANTNVSMMGESFKYAAPIFGALNYSAEDAAVGIGLMANAGIKGAQAGTTLRAAISSLTNPSKKAAEAMKQYGISLTDENGQMLSFSELMVQLRNNLGGLSEAEQTAAASTIFGTEAMSGMLAVVNASSADFEKLSSAVANSAGMTEKMAEIRLDNLQGDVTILKSALEGLGTAAYDKFSAPLRSAVQAVTAEIGKLTESIRNGELSASFEKVSSKLTEMAGEFLQFAVNRGIPALINAFEWVIDNSGRIISALEGIAAGYAAVKLMSWGAAQQAMIGGTTIAEQAGLMASSLANPVMAAGALAAALALVGAAVINYKRDQMEAKNAEIAYSMRDELDAVMRLKNGYAELDEAARNDAKAKIEEAEQVRALKSELDRYVDSSGKFIANKERAKELIEQINGIMPGTVSYLANETINYREASAAIDGYVKSKEKEAVLSYKAEGYGEAKSKVTELAKEFAQTDKLYEEQKAEQRKAIAEYEAEIARLQNDYAAIGYSGDEISSLINSELENTGSLLYQLRQKQDELSSAVGDTGILWSEQKGVLDGYYDSIREYEGLSQALAEGDDRAFSAILNGLRGFYDDYSDVSAAEISKNLSEMQALVDDWTEQSSLGNIPEYMLEQARNGLSDVTALAKDYIYATGNAVEGVVMTAGDYYERNAKAAAARTRGSMASALADAGVSPEITEAGEGLGAEFADSVSEGFAAELDDLKFDLELGKITDEQYNQRLGELLGQYDSSQTKAYRNYWSDFLSYQKGKAEKSASGINEVFEDAAEDLDFAKMLGKIDNDEYGKQLGDLLGQYDSVQTKAYSSYWSKYYSWQKEKQDADENAALKEIDTWKKASDKLISDYESRYSQIISKRDSMITKLSAKSLYEKINPDADEDDEPEYEYKLADNEKQKKKLDEYARMLEKLEKANASADFMTEFRGLDLDSALEAGKALASAKGGTAAYLKKWQENRDYEKKLADDYVKGEVEALNAEFEPKFKGLLSGLPAAFSENGRQSIQGYIDGLEEKKADADAEIAGVMDGVIAACREKLEIHSPSKVMYEMGEFTADGFIEGVKSKSSEIYDTIISVFGSAIDEVYAKMQAAMKFSMSAAAFDVSAASGIPKASDSAVSKPLTQRSGTVSGNEYNLYLNNDYFGKMVRRSVNSNGILTGNSGGVY